MFEQVLQLVKEHMGSNPQAANAIPEGQADAVHQEIATHVSNGLQGQAAQGGGLMQMLENGLAGGNTVTSAITGGLVGSLGSKFGMSPAATGAIAAAIPGLLQKFAQNHANGAAGNALNSLPGGLGSKLGGFFS